MNATPEAVWQEITKQGRNNWYFMLDVDGSFAAGQRVVWKAGGDIAEEAEVVRADPPRRLELRTTLRFAPNLAALPPHRLSWEVVPADGGSLVTLSWEAAPQASNLYESEGDGILRGLRLAVDPSASAELVRLPEIGDIEVHDVTPERVADYLDFFDHRAFRDFPAWQSCYCMETHRHHTDDEWSARQRRDDEAEARRRRACRRGLDLMLCHRRAVPRTRGGDEAARCGDRENAGARLAGCRGLPATPGGPLGAGALPRLAAHVRESRFRAVPRNRALLRHAQIAGMNIRVESTADRQGYEREQAPSHRAAQRPTCEEMKSTPATGRIRDPALPRRLATPGVSENKVMAGRSPANPAELR